ncbi:hypothetical protein GYH30_018312 [Glycine max]|nr:hypothetical protein GYH30_018312 [Glycine max]
MEASKGCREKERGMAALAVQITCVRALLHREIQRLLLQHQPQRVQYWPLKHASPSFQIYANITTLNSSHLELYLLQQLTVQQVNYYIHHSQRGSRKPIKLHFR